MFNLMEGTRLGATVTAFAKAKVATNRFAKGLCTLALVFLTIGQPLSARTVIDNDPGGPIEQRLQQIKRLRSEGAKVEIRGFCASSCTMLIGLPNACVRPGSRLGFHGPSSAIYGLGLPPDEFDYWSRIMANHYPNRMRSWFMSSARNELLGLHTISGRDAIKMGARPC